MMNGEKHINSPMGAIDGTDSLIPHLEQLVDMPKVAVEIPSKIRRDSIPNEIILKVKTSHNHYQHLKVLAMKSGGQWFISLVTERGDILRQYHQQYSSHTNPDGLEVGSSHKHFPTERFPLRESHRNIDTWAYDPGPFPSNFVEALKEFCNECNIEIEALQERSKVRWF